jgi:hypothetical protein
MGFQGACVSIANGIRRGRTRGLFPLYHLISLSSNCRIS